MDGRIFITGGSGFLGKTLLLAAEAEGWDASFTVYSRDETKQHHIRSRFPRVRCVLGDVRDRDRLTLAMAGHDVVIHAAAMKHIPRGEEQPSECLDTNVIGSRNVILAARENRVDRCLAISTDKVCEPRNAYGISKMFMERLWWEAAALPGPEFTLVRYGNVVGSTLSVVPIWREQARSGTVKLTAREMTRFWMSPSMVVETLHEGLRVEAGTTYVPKIPGMTLLDLIRAATPNAAVEVTGMRPGEKMHETLITAHESRYAIDQPRAFLLYPTTRPPFEPPLAPRQPYQSSSAPAVSVPTMVEWIAEAEAVDRMDPISALRFAHA